MSIKHSTPVLVAATSTGKKKFWQGFVDESNAHGRQVTIYTQYWQEGQSLRQTSAPTTVAGKNIGKANETTPLDQAIAEIDAKARKQRDKGYVEEGVETHEDGKSGSSGLVLPMLAHPFEKRAKDMAWPCIGQPKLDGVRCLSDGKRFWSRQGKPFDERVVAHLAFVGLGMILDGELMLPHDRYTFQQGISATKKFDPTLSPQLEYHVYDVVDDALSYLERWRLVEAVRDRVLATPNIRLVERRTLASFSDLIAYHGDNIERGFEGTMLRHPEGTYKVGHRSAHLLKYKDFLTEEFEIVGGREGRGKEAGSVVFTCKTKAGATFDVRPRGTDVERKRMYDELATLVGKPLTVRFQNYTDDGIPRFPVGLVVRDYE